MGRFFSPLLFLGAGAGVLWFNSQHTDRVLAFPFMTTLMPSLEGDLAGQGQATGMAMLVIGALLLALALFRRSPSRNAED